MLKVTNKTDGPYPGRFVMQRFSLSFAAFCLVLSVTFPCAHAQAPSIPILIVFMAKFAQINVVAILISATLAAEQINADGGVKGRKIELITYDDQGSASDA